MRTSVLFVLRMRIRWVHMIKSEPVAEIAWPQILAVRLQRQSLEQRGTKKDLIPLARTLCGFHGQVMSCAELTAAARLDGLNKGDFETALWRDRTLYKTWAMRGTLHILPSDQFSNWIAALSHLPRADDSASWRKYFDMSSDLVDTMLAATDAALKDEIHTRESLASAVGQLARQPELEEKLSGSWGAFLKPSARLGHVCFAPNDGQRVRFTHPLTWLPIVEDVDPEEGLRTAIRQFLHTYGPAHRQDFMRWFGVIKASIGDKLLASLDDETMQIRIAGESKPYTVLAADVDTLLSAAPSATVRLLPGFDQYVVNAPRGIEAILPGERKLEVYRPQGWISATVIVGGRIGGTWTHDLKPKVLTVEIAPFSSFSRTVKDEIEAEANRLATFFDRSLDLQYV